MIIRCKCKDKKGYNFVSEMCEMLIFYCDYCSEIILHVQAEYSQELKEDIRLTHLACFDEMYYTRFPEKKPKDSNELDDPF